MDERVTRLRQLAEHWSNHEAGSFFTDCANEIERLRSYWTGDKLTGGSHVCHTCAAHCLVIEDTRKLLAQWEGNCTGRYGSQSPCGLTADYTVPAERSADSAGGDHASGS